MIKLTDQHKLSYFNKGDAASVSKVSLSINYLQRSYALCDEVAMHGFHLLLRHGKSCGLSKDDRQAIMDGMCSPYGLYIIMEQYSLQPKKGKASPNQREDEVGWTSSEE